MRNKFIHSILLLLISSLCCLWLIYQHHLANKTLETLQQQRATQQTQISLQQQNQQDRQQYQTAFQQLVNSERFLNVPQLIWLEQLSQLQQETAFEFKFEPTQKLQIGQGQYQAQLHPISLQLTLKHEQQLLDFLLKLAKPEQGFLLQGCELERTTQTANLFTHCQIGWITFQERK